MYALLSVIQVWVLLNQKKFDVVVEAKVAWDETCTVLVPVQFLPTPQLFPNHILALTSCG